MMKYLSERLRELGSCFVFVITPSKATIYPEDIPDRYLPKPESRARLTNYEVLVLCYKSTAFHCGWAEITLEHKELFQCEFPTTGTHWTRAVAFFTTAALLKTIERESGREMPQLSESVESIDHRPDSRPIPANRSSEEPERFRSKRNLSTTTDWVTQSHPETQPALSSC
jgi:hypothetical protein